MLAQVLNRYQYIVQTTFNCMAIKSVFLRDDVLILRYSTKKGGIAELVFPDISDADTFFYNTLKNYRSGCFNFTDLEIFLLTIEKLIKSRISTSRSGFGSCSIAYARFVIIQAVDRINLTKKINRRQCLADVIKV